MSTGHLNPGWQLNDWINQLLLPDRIIKGVNDYFGGPESPSAHYINSYIRDLAVGGLIYYLVALLWCLWIYVIKKDKFWNTKEKMENYPTKESIIDQIKVAQTSLFLYAMLPVFSSWIVENGWTKAYHSIDDIGGWQQYILWTIIYFICVEFGVYWMHRELHEIKFLYKYVHSIHHKYNRPEMLSPFASIAFNPIDGILQASPYVICLFLIPCHYLTHLVLVFCTAIWATNIHDAVGDPIPIIMGSHYHTIHHTHYMYNHGQYTVFFDWLFGTLKKDVELKRTKKKMK